jgi:hypothetical protein
MKYYDGNKPGGTPGMITSIGEFNWWEAGALFGQVSPLLFLEHLCVSLTIPIDGGILVSDESSSNTTSYMS